MCGSLNYPKNKVDQLPGKPAGFTSFFGPWPWRQTFGSAHLSSLFPHVLKTSLLPMMFSVPVKHQVVLLQKYVARWTYTNKQHCAPAHRSTGSATAHVARERPKGLGKFSGVWLGKHGC